MDAITLKFIEHDKRWACEFCIFRIHSQGRDKYECAHDNSDDESWRELPCRAEGGVVSRTDGKDGYWTI